MNELEKFFLYQDEPMRACLLLLRAQILDYNNAIIEAWKFNMPFYVYKGQRIYYLWLHKKMGWPFIRFTDGKRMEHPLLIFEKRSRIKIMLIDPYNELPVKDIDAVLAAALAICNNDS